MKKTVYFSARTQFENMGDLLINRALLLIVNKDAEIIIDSKNVPKWYIDLLITDLENIKLIDGFFYFKLIKQAFNKKFKSSLFLILKPGGYIGINNFKMGTFRFLQGILFRLLRSLTVKVIRAPSSHANSSKYWGLIDRFRLSAVNTQLIRDSLSIELLEQQNFVIQKVPDLAFYYFANPADSVFNSTKAAKHTLDYTISFRRPRSEIDLQIYQSVLDFVVGKSKSIAFTSQVEFDNNVNSKYANELSKPIRAYNRDQKTIQQVLDCYSESNFVISNRLHVLLVALLCGATPIALLGPNDKKIKGVFEDLGIGSSVINYDSNGLLELKEFHKIDHHKGLNLLDNSKLLTSTLLSSLK
jgi:hypothetical protein